MNRFQKKCLVFSAGLHGLLAVILLASAGFSSKPPASDLQFMTLIPATVVDRAGAGGGSPAHLTQLPQPAPAPAPAPQTVQTQKFDHAEPVQPPQRREPVRPAPPKEEEAAPEPKPKTTKPLPQEEPKDLSFEPKSKPRHEIHVSYTPVNSGSAASTKRTARNSSSTSAVKAESLRKKEIENALAELASGVRSSGSPSTTVDVAGIGGGPAFIDYKNAVYLIYKNAWITPASAASRDASAEASVTIARDGSIISAELIRSSGDTALDRSVERVLRDVTKLPSFPPSTQDTQRTFVIRFHPDPDSKETTG